MVELEKGPTPGKRYGHSLVYYKPFFILFGGVTGSDNHYSINSDTYVYYIATKTWQKLNRKNI